MAAVGIVCEYNPFHRGHLYQLQQLKKQNREILCVMSGNFVQRGEFALLDKMSRAEAAVRSGADLVLELPVAWATASAETFAYGAIALLQATGIVDTLCFGSEGGTERELCRIASALQSETVESFLREELKQGDSFPAARQRAVERFLGEPLPLLSQPNALLGIEYAKAIQRLQAPIALQPLLRQGAEHDGVPVGEFASASYLRRCLREGQSVGDYWNPIMAEIWTREQRAGRVTSAEYWERPLLARLRSLSEADWERYTEDREGLSHRLYATVQATDSIEALLTQAKTKRYPYARLRRTLLHAYLDISPSARVGQPPYLRVLAMGERGSALLKEMKSTASLPVLQRPSQARRLGKTICETMETEARATALYQLGQKTLGIAEQEWKCTPYRIQEEL